MLHVDLNDPENLDLTLNNISSNAPNLLALCDRFDIQPGSAPRAFFGRSGRVRVVHRKRVHVCEVTILPYDPNLSEQITIWAYYKGSVAGTAKGAFTRLFAYSTALQEKREARKKKAAEKRKKERDKERRRKKQ